MSHHRVSGKDDYKSNNGETPGAPSEGGEATGESKVVIAHLVTPYLFHTGSWVYSQLVGLHKFRSVVFTQKKENVNQFPFDEIYSLEDLPVWKRHVSRVYRRAFDSYGLFFDEWFKRLKPKLVHAHFGFEGARWLHIVKKKRLPMVTTFYGQDVSKLGRIPLWQKRYVELFNYGSVFLAEGNFLKKQLVNLGCREDKVIVQHLGVDLGKYPHKKYTSGINNRPVVILQVSSFREKKGIEYSLEAIAHLRDAGINVKYRLIGSGDTSEANERIASMVQRLNLTAYVTLLGAMGHNDTKQEMAAADIFLHPSVTATDGDNEGGAPVGIIEASAVGLPVISTFHADIPEVVLDGKTGYLVNERNSRLLAAKLTELIEDPVKRMFFGEAGREHVALNYNLEIQLRKLENIYERFI